MITFYNHNIWNHNPSEHRNTLVRSLISDFDPDICSFQECGPDTNRVGDAPIMELMGDLYVEATPEFAHMNYTPVLYKKDKFDLIDKGYVLFDGKNDCNSKGVTWAVLEDKETKKKYAFASTHFWWMWHDFEVDNQQRINNAKQIKEICDAIIEKYNIPVIVGGDLNNGEKSFQGDEPYKKLLEWGFRDARLIAEETTDSHTCKEGYPVLNEDGKTYSKCEIEPEYTIDYILIYGDDSVRVKKLYIETNDKAMTASDHCPLIAELDI